MVLLSLCGVAWMQGYMARDRHLACRASQLWLRQCGRGHAGAVPEGGRAACFGHPVGTHRRRGLRGRDHEGRQAPTIKQAHRPSTRVLDTTSMPGGRLPHAGPLQYPSSWLHVQRGSMEQSPYLTHLMTHCHRCMLPTHLLTIQAALHMHASIAETASSGQPRTCFEAGVDLRGVAGGE